MVCRCVAAGCSHTNKDGVSLYKFPKDSGLKVLAHSNARALLN